MLKWVLGLFRRKNLGDIIFETKDVSFKGVSFKIRKINILDHLSGANVIKQIYDTHKSDISGNVSALMSDKKIKQHFSDVLISGVMSPKISLENDGSGFFVERIFIDWELVNFLYTEIMAFTYGKKKIKLSS